MKKCFMLSALGSTSLALLAKEYHASIKGNDANHGLIEMPFRRISHAAQIAKARDSTRRPIRSNRFSYFKNSASSRPGRVPEGPMAHTPQTKQPMANQWKLNYT